MTISLFRKEVTKNRAREIHGEVILNEPVTLKRLVFAAIICTSLIISFLIGGTYSKKTQVPGYLRSLKGDVRIISPERGIIEDSLVYEGKAVRRGDILFSISTTHERYFKDDRDKAILHELKVQKNILEKQLQIQEKIDKNSSIVKQKKISSLKAELVLLRETLRIQKKQLFDFEEKTKRFKSLYQNKYISKTLLDELHLKTVESNLQFQLSLQKELQLKNKLDELELSLSSHQFEYEKNIAIKLEKISVIEQKIIETDARRSLVIRAPIQGKVTAITGIQGQLTSSQKPLAIVIPDNDIFIAEIFVPAKAIGQIKLNQVVKIQYSAFPYQHYGTQKAIVNQISEAILLPGEIPTPVNLSEPVYKVIAQLDSQVFNKQNKRMPLKAGMLFVAEIIQERRSLLDWMMEPFYGYKVINQ